MGQRPGPSHTAGTVCGFPRRGLGTHHPCSPRGPLGAKVQPRDPPAQENWVPRSLGAGKGLQLPGHSSGLRVSGQAQGHGLPRGTLWAQHQGPWALCVQGVLSHPLGTWWVQSAALGAGAWPLEQRPRGRHVPAAERPWAAADARGPRELQGRLGSPPLAPGGWPSRWQRALAARPPQRSKGHGVKASRAATGHTCPPRHAGKPRASACTPARR